MRKSTEERFFTRINLDFAHAVPEEIALVVKVRIELSCASRPTVRVCNYGCCQAIDVSTPSYGRLRVS